MNNLLVIGAPRSGFSLTISILSHTLKHKPVIYPSRQKALNEVIKVATKKFKKDFYSFFEKRVGLDNLIFSGEFELLVGGPKWLEGNEAVVRKYVGIKDVGDFTLLLYLPQWALNYYPIVHSHYNPSRWVEDHYYDRYLKFITIRDPRGILNSAAFSINALTSEYLIKCVKDFDEDEVREKMAIYRLTDLEMFKGLVKWLKSYLDELKGVLIFYNVVKWEDIISNPVDTIQRLGTLRGITLRKEDASEIWDKLSYRNTLVYHRFNFRKGGGRIGDWKTKLTNYHLEIIKEEGLDEFIEFFGYEKLTFLNRKDYTDFQLKVSECIKKGKVCNEVEDRNLFIFNWNKSNIADTAHDFKRYERRNYIKIERSSLSDTELLSDFEEYIDEAVTFIVNMLNDFSENIENFSSVRKKYESILDVDCREEFDRAERVLNEGVEVPE